MIEELLLKIRLNKISSVEVSDALDKSGVIPHLHALNTGKYIAGNIVYVCAWGESNWSVHDQVRSAPAGSIVFVDAYECKDRAVLGDIVCKQLFVYQGIQGLVVNGMVRDVHRLIKEDYSIWCRGTTPVGCHNNNVEPSIATKALIQERRKLFEASILVADDSGVTIIPSNSQTPSLMEKLDYIELQEDIWYYCLDTLKMNTYDIICLKQYMSNHDILPNALRSKLGFLESK
jgi:4-hydroxy-4-methyl-2-oxoglutarate aldolase